MGDFNGDGVLDLAVANWCGNDLIVSAGTESILLGDGTGSFSPAATSPITVGDNPSSVAVGDFNGDGNLDLAVANFNDNTVTILKGDGAGNFRPPRRPRYRLESIRLRLRWATSTAMGTPTWPWPTSATAPSRCCTHAGPKAPPHLCRSPPRHHIMSWPVMRGTRLRIKPVDNDQLAGIVGHGAGVDAGGRDHLRHNIERAAERDNRLRRHAGAKYMCLHRNSQRRKRSPVDSWTVLDVKPSTLGVSCTGLYPRQRVQRR